jgi:hypothetical protein
MTGALTQNQAIAATSTDGIVLATSSVATVGAQKRSPRLRLSGSGWKTNATAAAQPVDWIVENVPVQGAANPSADVVFSHQVNNGGYVEKLRLKSDQSLYYAGADGSYNGLLKFGSYAFVMTTTPANFGSFAVLCGNRQVVAGGGATFSLSAGAAESGGDVGYGRNSSTCGEVNNATPIANGGAYRDLKLRNLLAGGGNGSYVQTPSMTVANLASAATAGAGARAFVTDATATTFLSVVAGGGANKVPVVSDGANWLIG